MFGSESVKGHLEIEGDMSKSLAFFMMHCFCFVWLWFNNPVNSYGHVEMVT